MHGPDRLGPHRRLRRRSPTDPYTGTGRRRHRAGRAAGGRVRRQPASGRRWSRARPRHPSSRSTSRRTSTASGRRPQQFDVPAQNLVYADVDGNIGYQTPGKLPIRGAGDGSMPQPGWDSAYDWQGFIPFEELPVVATTPPRATSSPPTTRSSASDYPLLPHAGLGLRLACRAHRRPAPAQVARRAAHRRRHARHPGRQRVRHGQAPGRGLRGRRDRTARPGCRARPAAVVGCAEQRRLGCRRLRQRAVGRARDQTSSSPAESTPAPVTGQGRLFLVVERPARRPRLRVVDQRGARRGRAGGDARARRDRRRTTGSSRSRATTRRGGTGARCMR